MDDNRFIWEQCGKLAYTVEKDTDAAWNRFKEKLESGAFASNHPLYRKPVHWWTGLAAAVVTVIAIVWWLVPSSPNQQKNTSVQNPARFDTAIGPCTLVMSDGSMVRLDTSAVFTWPHSFATDKREVSLSGSGFFSVARDASYPFVIHLNDVTVKVLGTSFKLKSAKGFAQINVRTGKVVVTRGNDSILLIPGEEVMVLQNDQGSLRKENTVQQAENLFIVKDILMDMKRKGIIKESSRVKSFVVAQNSLWINDTLQPTGWPWNAIRLNYITPDRRVIRYDSRYEPVAW